MEGERTGGMGSGSVAAARVRRWPVLVVFALASLGWSIPSAVGEAADFGASAGGVGGRRSLLSFQEAKGNVSFLCSPAGPCLPCQYSEKNDDKYRCSETGYRVPLKCEKIKDSTAAVNKTKAQRKLFSIQKHPSAAQNKLFTTISNYKWRKLLSASGKSKKEKESYITYRSCVPVDSEKLSVIGFEVIMVGLLLISGSVVYLRQKRTAVMSGIAATRIPTSSSRF